MPGPAATIGSMHTCPMCNTGGSPHVGGPVTGPGVPTVLIGGKPAAVMGDMCTCSGPPDIIVKGEATVLIGGKPAATIGSNTAHGGLVTVGEPTVLIGTGSSGVSTVMPIKKIPFPKISAALKVMASLKGNSDQLNEAIANQEQIRNEAENNEGEPRIYNLKWVKEDKRVYESKVLKEITLRASVLNIPDGKSVTFTLKKPVKTIEENEDNTTDENTSSSNTEEYEDYITLTGTVKDKMVEVVWEIEDPNQNEEAS
ncbi:hypothetical protein DZC78_02690 [Olleya aquimaris]|nr:hypothetical protein DZC78_02690 [Olleya aquimaris]